MHVIVRSRYELHVGSFKNSGADAVFGDEHEVGESLAGHLCDWIDFPKRDKSGTPQTNATG